MLFHKRFVNTFRATYLNFTFESVEEVGRLGTVGRISRGKGNRWTWRRMQYTKEEE